MTAKPKRPGLLPACRFFVSSCPAKAGHPVNATVSDRAEKLRRTGSPGQAGRRQRWTSLRLCPLRRRGRPRLDQRVVVDGFALRLLVRQLALGRDGAVLLRLGEPMLGGLLLVQLRPALLLHAGLLKTFE